MHAVGKFIAASLQRRGVFYGWAIVAAATCASFARQGASVATLSMFVVPMSMEFDWSRSAVSGAVSLGGLLGALVAPGFGKLVDRTGSRALLAGSVIAVSVAAFALSGITGLVGFYVFFGLGRLAFAGPFDVGINTAVANWFVRERARAMAWVGVTTALSLAVMPLFAGLLIDAAGWRVGWLGVGVSVLVVGLAPILILLQRRPEDLGMTPDGSDAHADTGDGRNAVDDRAYTRAEAVRTPVFWLLMVYTALAFCMQAGISLHQAPLLIEKGISPALAATIVSTFSLSAALGAWVFGRLATSVPLRVLLPAVALQLVVAALTMRGIASPLGGYVAAALFGIGIGGLLTLPQVAFADYFGRRHFGAIRGLALPAQVGGQAMGPLLAGVLHDLTGSYQASMAAFAGLGILAAVVGALAAPPPAHVPSPMPSPTPPPGPDS